MATTPALIASQYIWMNETNLINTKLGIKVLATNWGFQGTIDEFCKKAKAESYDGIELWWSSKAEDQKALFNALQKHDLEIGFLTTGNSSEFEEHQISFRKNVEAASDSLTQKPLYINCHSGRDFFTTEQNEKLISYTIDRSLQTGIEILHETHRSRMCYSAPLTRKYLEKFPEMGITLDISHWTNVHESMLDDQKHNVDLALQRTRHIHARIGHKEGPQVNDPRAPEWDYTLNKHLSWWDQAISYREKTGAKHMTFLAEFGPPNYLQALPFTRQPVADQWAINVYMMQLLRKRYKTI